MTGALIAALTGSSGESRPATTCERRSRSVTMPKSSSSRSTRTLLTSSAFIRRAASRSVVSGLQITGGRLTRSAAYCRATSGIAASPFVSRGRPGAREQRMRQEPQARGTAEERDDVVGRQRVEERVLLGARLVPGGLSGEHRWMAEHLALAEQVDRATPIDEFDRSAADHADPALWPLALRKDRRAGREELDLGPAREPLQLSLVEPAEGVPRPPGTRRCHASDSAGQSRSARERAAACSTVGSIGST